MGHGLAPVLDQHLVHGERAAHALRGGAGGEGGAHDTVDVAPQLGDKIADLTIVDAQGEPVNIRDLASRSPYTVLTLGCLT